MRISRPAAGQEGTAEVKAVKMKVPKEEVMSDVLKRLTGESALPVYSNIQKFKRDKDGLYFVAEDFNESVKKREMVNAKERMRVSVFVR